MSAESGNEPHVLSYVRKRSLRGNRRFPQHRFGYLTYTLQALFSAENPQEAFREYFESDLEKDAVAVSEAALKAHKTFRVGHKKFVFFGEFIPRAVSNDVPTLLSFERGRVRETASRLLTGHSSYWDNAPVLNALETRQEEFGVIRACLDAAVDVMEHDPKAKKWLKSYARKFRHGNARSAGDFGYRIIERVCKMAGENVIRRNPGNEGRVGGIMRTLEFM